MKQNPSNAQDHNAQAIMLPTPRSNALRMVQNGGWLLGGKTFGALLSLIYLAVLTRSLGPENFGLFALVFSMAQLIAGLVSFQTWQIILHYGTRDILEERPDRFAQLVLLCCAFDVASLLSGALIAAISAFALGVYYQWSAGFSTYVMVFCWILLLASRGTPGGILRVHDRFRDAALGDSLVPVVRLLGVGIVVLMAPNVVNFLTVWALSELLTTLLMWIVIWRSVRLPFGKPTMQNVLAEYRRYPGIGRFAAFTNLGASLKLASQQFIVVIVGFFVGPAAAGFFRLGHQLGQVMARIADAIAQVLFAEYNRIAYTDGYAATRILVKKTFKITALSAITLLLILVFWGKPLLITTFGAAFAPAYPLVLILGGAAAMQVGASAFEPALLARGQAGQALMAGALSLGALLILLPLLLPTYQEQGAAFAVLFAALVSSGWLARAYWKTTL
jgi:O-antigen/teichoic acid export membrane protein